MRKIVYTALCGQKDRLLPAYKEGWKFICFTDQPRESIPPEWEYVKAEIISDDPNRNAKQYKVLPHKFLPEHDVSIWMDANYKITGDINELLKHEVLLFKHFERTCLYDETTVVKEMGLDSKSIISKQIDKYQKEGFPKNYNPFPENAVIVRKNTPNISELNELWWNEIVNGSRRDQLSFMYCVWKLDFFKKGLYICDEILRDNQYFRWLPHLNMGQLLEVK